MHSHYKMPVSQNLITRTIYFFVTLNVIKNSINACYIKIIKHIKIWSEIILTLDCSDCKCFTVLQQAWKKNHDSGIFVTFLHYHVVIKKHWKLNVSVNSYVLEQIQ